MTVLGHVRVLQAATNQEVPQMVRMVRAEVDQALINSPIELWVYRWETSQRQFSGSLIGFSYSP